jgi:hypothetical protein
MPVPLLAIENSDRYVAGAYLVFLLLLLIYVAIMAAKLSRIQRELGSLAELAETTRGRGAGHDVGQIHGREEAIETVREQSRREEAAR